MTALTGFPAFGGQTTSVRYVYDASTSWMADTMYATHEFVCNSGDASTLYVHDENFWVNHGTAGDYVVAPMQIESIQYHAIISTHVASSFYPFQFGSPTRRSRMARRRLKKRMKRIAKANAKALILLKSVIGQKTYKSFQKRGFLEVRGISGIRYRLRPSHKIDVMAGPQGNKVVERFCLIHADLNMPPVDTLIAQLLLIKSGKEGETKLREIGIRHAA